MSEAVYKAFLSGINPRHLELRLFATEKCNFRCTYCYEDFELGRMSHEVRNGIKALMTARAKAGLESLYISWFGGEPLMGLEVIEEIETHRIQLVALYPELKSHASGITTNAYLLDETMLRKLVGWGVTSYQITLDGPEEHHNQTRLRADGAGTFSVVYGNLLAAAATELDFTITLRLHLHHENIEAVENDLLPQLINDFGGDERFKLHPISIGNYGGAFETNKMRTTTRQIADAVRQRILTRFNAAKKIAPSATAQHEPIPARANPIAVAGPAAEGEADVCYAAAANSFGIRSDGRIVKCTTALDDARNDIGKILESGEIKLDPELVKMWMVGFYSGKPSELGCPLYRVRTLSVPENRKYIPIQAL
ncbi:radical SAM protein [Paucibacter sp. DJ2R-2]|nr:radical SAM protein [Paucibacter sp. DJ2R-2]